MSYVRSTNASRRLAELRRTQYLHISVQVGPIQTPAGIVMGRTKIGDGRTYVRQTEKVKRPGRLRRWENHIRRTAAQHQEAA